MENCKFKEGDFVRILPWKKLEKEFGLNDVSIDVHPVFTLGMRDYCGEVHRIEIVDEHDNSYVLEGCGGYWFAEDTLEAAEELEKLRAGDRVLIRSWESMEKEFGLDEDGDIDTPEFVYFKHRKDLCGTTLVVEAVDHSDGTFKDEEGRWFPLCCVNKVTEENKETVTGLADTQEHYKKSAMQPIEVMQTFFTPEQFKGFLLGNFVKYSMRANFKGQTTSDRDKAKQYLYWYSLVKDDTNYRICPETDVPDDEFTGEGVFAG